MSSAGWRVLRRAQTTEKMILALSSLFRYNLKTPEQFVLLAKGAERGCGLYVSAADALRGADPL